MPTYYISPYGSDKNNGLSTDPTGSTNRPWRTLKWALESGGLAAGDTVYVAPGDYGGTITCAYSGNADSDAGRIKIYGDPRNEQGFTTDGTNLIKPGFCNVLERANRVSKYSSSSVSLLNLNGKDYLTFKSLNFSRNYYQSTSYYVIAASASIYINFDGCCIFSPSQAFYIQNASNSALYWNITNCIIYSFSYGIQLLPTNPTSDTNLQVTISNCFIQSFGSSCIYVNHTAAGASLGATVQNCTCVSSFSSGAIRYGTSSYVGTQVLTVSNSFVWAGSTNAFSASVTGQIVTNNCFYGGTLSNHNKGANDVCVTGNNAIDSDIPILLEFGQSALWGFQPKPFFTPLGLPGIGASSLAGMPSTDLLGNSRPSGGGIRPWLDYGVALAEFTLKNTSTTTSLVNNTASGYTTASAWIGYKVRITAAGSGDPATGSYHVITANTADALTITPALSAAPDSGSAKAEIIAEAGMGLWKAALGGSGEIRTGCGWCSSASSSTIVDSTKGWVADSLIGLRVTVTNGTGLAQSRLITDNDGTTLTVSPNWSVNPSTDSRFIIHGRDNVAGTATSGASTSVTDSGATWPVDGWVGYKVKITDHTGAGQERWISSNTATVLTVTPSFVTNPDNTSDYLIYDPAVDKAVGCYELANTAEKETSAAIVDGGTGSCIKIVGPGTHDILVPIKASTAKVITIKVRYDSNHSATNKPQVTRFANLSAITSDTDETLTCTGAISAGNSLSDWETLSFTTFTPTVNSWVKIRLISRAASGNGIAYFDTLSN